jgi:hypothetical protein
MGVVQKHHKKRFTKKIVSKSFYKKFDQKYKTVFSLYFFYHVFDPGPFLASDPPTHHGAHRFCFGGPLTAPQPA